MLDAALVRDLSVEGDAHEVGHPVQQAGHVAQLVPRVLHTEGPGVVDEEHAAGELGWHHTPRWCYPQGSLTHAHTCSEQMLPFPGDGVIANLLLVTKSLPEHTLGHCRSNFPAVIYTLVLL